MQAITLDFTMDVHESLEDSWQTRMMLESICASVENIAEDFSADVAMFPEFGETL